MYSSLEKMETLFSECLVTVMHNGDMSWMPAVKLTVTCPAVGDGYHCIWKFGSWSMDKVQLDMQLIGNDIDMTRYTPNPEWAVSNSTAVRGEEKYSCCPGVYADITFGLNVKKREHKEEKKNQQAEGDDDKE